jgi:hypothetical protein
MGIPREARPVKLFTALLFAGEAIVDEAGEDLQRIFGPMDLKSETVPWELTDYYKEEMGGGLLRRFVSFETLVSPETLPDAKLSVQLIEERRRRKPEEGGGRAINIDPGYLDAGKVVLASTKPALHRLYLRSGIYGEVTLGYQRGSFHPFATTYPDYRWSLSVEFFSRVRSLYLDQLRRHGY